MKSATAKEQTMKTRLTSSYIRLTALIITAAPLAAVMGASRFNG